MRRLARDVRSGYAEMDSTGKVSEGVALANASHVRELVEMLEAL